MPLVSAAGMMANARREGYAVPAFAAYTLETIRAVVEAAEELKSPVMIQTTSATLDFVGLKYFAAAVKAVTNDVTVPIALHLDHGQSFEWVVRCIREGYTSVMIDGSELPFEDNINLVKQVVQLAHAVGVSVEAELGKIGGVEDELEVEHDAYTDPKAAEQFVERTGVDALAVSIGSHHGVYTAEPNLDFARLLEIADHVKIPIVLHGASGIPPALIRQAIGLGVSKVNIATELKLEMARTLRDFFSDNPTKSDPREYLSLLKSAVKSKVKEIIRITGAEDRVFE